MIALLCEGHATAGGRTRNRQDLGDQNAFSTFYASNFQRVQCTSDLMPADIIGTNVLNLASSTFQLHPGPVFYSPSTGG